MYLLAIVETLESGGRRWPRRVDAEHAWFAGGHLKYPFAALETPKTAMKLSGWVFRLEAAQGPYYKSFQALSLRKRGQRSLGEQASEPLFVVRRHLFG